MAESTRAGLFERPVNPGREGLRSHIRATPKAAERKQVTAKTDTIEKTNPKMGNTKWPSAKSSMIDSSPIKARKEKAQTKPATKSSTIKPSSIMPREPKAETNPPRYSQMLKIERPYLKAPELQTREMAEERLSYPLEHKGGCQLADVRSNTIFGKVCVCITGRPSPEPEEEDASPSCHTQAPFSSKPSTMFSSGMAHKDIMSFGEGSPSTSAPSINLPAWGSDHLQSPTSIFSTSYDTSPSISSHSSTGQSSSFADDFVSMNPSPPPPSNPSTIQQAPGFFLPVPPMLKHAASFWFIPGQVPPTDLDLDLITVPTDLDSARVCAEYYTDEFSKFINRFKILEAKFVVQIHEWALGLTQVTDSNFSNYLRHLPTSDAEEWMSARGTKKLMALRRMGEIIFGVLNEIQDAVADRRAEIERREIEGIVVEVDSEPVTWQERSIDETWEVAFTDLNKLFVHSSRWEHTMEFCRMLLVPYVEPLREYWEPIVVYHFGRSVEELADRAILPL